MNVSSGDNAGIAAVVDEATSGKERMWLILSHCDNGGLIQAYLEDRYGNDSVLMERELIGIRVFLFDLTKRKTID